MKVVLLHALPKFLIVSHSSLFGRHTCVGSTTGVAQWGAGVNTFGVRLEVLVVCSHQLLLKRLFLMFLAKIQRFQRSGFLLLHVSQNAEHLSRRC